MTDHNMRELLDMEGEYDLLAQFPKSDEQVKFERVWRSLHWARLEIERLRSWVEDLEEFERGLASLRRILSK